MINQKSDYLVILVATYNRLESLKRSIQSIASGTSCSHEIVIIDGGSTDGTIEYLQSNPNVTPVFQGELIGQARACNQVWRQVDSKYTCWLNDDTELVPGSLDLAVDILEKHPKIGMVGLKMKDVGNPKAYLGALSEYGILNCNHGVLPTKLLQPLGYFNEDYRSYGIDPDLTASVLCAGKAVVMTKQVSVLHYRAPTDQKKRREELDEYKNIYHQKFKFLVASTKSHESQKKLRKLILTWLFRGAKGNSNRLGLNKRDRKVLLRGSFFSWTDVFVHLLREFYLVQRVPPELLRVDGNPYRHLLD